MYIFFDYNTNELALFDDVKELDNFTAEYGANFYRSYTMWPEEKKDYIIRYVCIINPEFSDWVPVSFKKEA